MQDRIAYQGITFDDVLLEPAFSDVLPRDVDVRTRLTRSIWLNLPILSSPMDTVTESDLAIALAQEGGLGVIHKNLTAMQQAAEVARVKRYESGLLRDPVTIGLRCQDAGARARAAESLYRPLAAGHPPAEVAAAHATGAALPPLKYPSASAAFAAFDRMPMGGTPRDRLPRRRGTSRYLTKGGVRR